jgi:hypothetical protein
MPRGQWKSLYVSQTGDELFHNAAYVFYVERLRQNVYIPWRGDDLPGEASASIHTKGEASSTCVE